MKTHSVKSADIQKRWILVDAEGQSVGRLASKIAHILRGKNKPTFVPHLDCGDNVVVINAAKVQFSGQKWEDKFYYHHTGYAGGIKEISAKDLFAKYPERIIENAVKGMIPHTKLGRKQMKNLKVYRAGEHKQAAQKPEVVPSI